MIIIKRIDSISHTEALTLALEAWQELSERGFTNNTMLVNWDHKAIVAYNGKYALGIITYQIVEWQNTLHINIGYVKEIMRGQGIYRDLWNEIIKIAREKKLAQIVGSTHVRNVPMRAVAAQLGRIEESVTMVYNVVDEPD